jgi:hypothetical protein
LHVAKEIAEHEVTRAHIFYLGEGRGGCEAIENRTFFVPNVFPIAPHFYPMSFVQSSPLLTYIAGPKGKFSIFTQKLQASEKSGIFFKFWFLGCVVVKVIPV